MISHSKFKLPTDALEKFKDDGYLSLHPLYEANQLTELNDQVERFIRDVVPTMPQEQVYFEDKANRSTLKQLQKMFEFDDYFRDLMENGAPRQIAEEVLQDEVVPVNMQYFNKPPGIGQPTPAHQDGYYFHLNPCEAVTGWLALENVDEENGCIHYLRGSHKKTELRSHGQSGVLGFSQGITDFGSPADYANEVSFPGTGGTFLMHHAKTVHWASGNTSKSRTRKALGFIYYAKRAKLDHIAKDAYQTALDAQLKITKMI